MEHISRQLAKNMARVHALNARIHHMFGDKDKERYHIEMWNMYEGLANGQSST